MDVFNFIWYAVAAERVSKRAAAPLPGDRMLEFPKEGVAARVRKRKRREREDTRAVGALNRFWRWLMGEDLVEEHEAPVNAALHLTLAGVIGAAYGLAVENLGEDGRRHGVSLGGAAVAITDQMTGAVFGGEPERAQDAVGEDARKLGSRMVYALTLEGVRGFVRRALD
jgi:hypothetical protein